MARADHRMWVLTPRRDAGLPPASVILGLGLILNLIVFGLNRGPTLYWDTISYFNAGQEVLSVLLGEGSGPVRGEDPGPAAPASTTPDARGINADAVKPGPDTPGVEPVMVNRSIYYALLLRLTDGLASLDGIVFVNLLGLALAMGLTALALRGQWEGAQALRLTGVMLTAAALGAAPFYVAYAMPDIFAPILILSAAVIAVFGARLDRIPLALALALCVGGAVMHLSHLAILAALVPLALLAALIQREQRWWRAPGALGLALVAALIAQSVYVKAAESTGAPQEKATTLPFLTVRTLFDGPGTTYLKEHCPDPAIAACAFAHTEPVRTPNRFLFSKDPAEGFYRPISNDTKVQLGAQDRQFFFTVLRTYPVRQTLAMLENSLDQLQRFDVRATLTEDTLTRSLASGDNAGERHASLLEVADDSALSPDQSWTGWLHGLHGLVYGVSFGIVALLLVWPASRVPRDLRLLVLIVLAGIAANAVACGAVSEPANRYGGRVIFLLPVCAALLAMASAAGFWKDLRETLLIVLPRHGDHI